MKCLSLAASLLIFGGLSMVAASAHAQVINAPFSGTQDDTCTIDPPLGVTLAATVTGEMALTNQGTVFSSVADGGSSAKIAFFCTDSFTASVDETTVSNNNNGTTGDTVFNVFNPGFNGNLGTDSVTGNLGVNVLDVDLSATTSDSNVIAAGDYNFIVPVTITAGS